MGFRIFGFPRSQPGSAIAIERRRVSPGTYYDLITQAGLDLQYTLDAWLWKFESIVHEGHGSTFGAMVGGFEYTIFQIADTDDGLLMKYH